MNLAIKLKTNCLLRYFISITRPAGYSFLRKIPSVILTRTISVEKKNMNKEDVSNRMDELVKMELPLFLVKGWHDEKKGWQDEKKAWQGEKKAWRDERKAFWDEQRRLQSASCRGC